MQFVLFIYHGTTPTPASESWASVSAEEKKAIYAEYAEVNKIPGLTPGLPPGLPKDASTVRVKDGETMVTSGPFVDVHGAVGGYCVVEAEDLAAAVKVAARIPAARLGGAIEIRPVAKYW